MQTNLAPDSARLAAERTVMRAHGLSDAMNFGGNLSAADHRHGADMDAPSFIPVGSTSVHQASGFGQDFELVTGFNTRREWWTV